MRVKDIFARGFRKGRKSGGRKSPREVEMEEMGKEGKIQLLCLSCQEEEEEEEEEEELRNEPSQHLSNQLPSVHKFRGKLKLPSLEKSGKFCAENYACAGASEEQVYRGTTEENTMPQYPEEMTEFLPLRGSEEWTEPGTGLFRSHTRTLSWAFFFGALALSALIFFGVLAVVLELQSSKAGPSMDVAELPTAPPFVPPSGPIELPNTTSPLSTATDLEAMLKLKWPLDDVQTRQSKDFMAALNAAAPSADIIPVIIPIPLSKQATDQMVLDGLAAGAKARAAREATEESLVALGMKIRSGSPAAAYTIGLRATSDESVRRGMAGYQMVKASQRIAQALNLTKEEASHGIVFQNGTEPQLQLNEFCWENVTEIECNQTEIYRRYDGSCNNLRHPRWGATHQVFRRILLPDYADGISDPRVGQDGAPLPNSRDITAYILQDDPSDDPSASFLLALWGQFVDQDVASAPQSTGINGTGLACCVDGKLLGAAKHPECFSIAVSPIDPFYADKGQSCFNFARSAPAPVCQFGPREQFNQISSYLDGSTLYGSTLDESKDVKGRWGFATAWNPGRLPTSYIEDGRPLPMRSVDLDDGCNLPERVEQKEFCFKSGDKRVNEYLGMTTFNLVWIRQHNLVSEHLVAENPDWEEVRIFEESRRIVIAQIQHITYNEFLPLLLGNRVMGATGLELLPNGYYTQYDQDVDASISDAFAGAAFRVGHSMIQGLIKMIGPHWKNEDFIQISKLFYDPFPLYKFGKMDEIMRGHAALPCGRANLHFSKQVTEHLFQLRNNSYGLDLPALDIQRGRDHGLPSYLEWRKVCNLPPVTSFNDLTGIWPRGAVEHVTAIYNQVEDIDLYIGGLAELPVEGGMVGPLFACILADQFLRLRQGDRFWYEGDIQVKPFTPGQLQEIRKTTLARVICDNSDAILSMQPKAMEQQSATNPRVPCSSDLIPEPKWGGWKEKTLQSGILKSAPNSAPPDSLESEFEEDDQEERFQEEREKDLNRPLNATTSTITANQNRNRTTRTNAASSRILLMSAAGGARNAEVETTPRNNLQFHQTKDGILLEWGTVKRSLRSGSHREAKAKSIPD